MASTKKRKRVISRHALRGYIGHLINIPEAPTKIIEVTPEKFFLVKSDKKYSPIINRAMKSGYIFQSVIQ